MQDVQVVSSIVWKQGGYKRISYRFQRSIGDRENKRSPKQNE